MARSAPASRLTPSPARVPQAKHLAMSFWAFVKWYPFRPEVKPFTIGCCVATVLLGSLSGGTEEQKKNSTYMNPPKH